MKTEMVRARIKPDLKAEAEQVLNELGISPTAAITILYRQIVLRGGLPFDVLLPNEKTRKALLDSAAGKNLLSAKSADKMFERLGIKKGQSETERNHHVRENVREAVQERSEEDDQPR